MTYPYELFGADFINAWYLIIVTQNNNPQALSVKKNLSTVSDYFHKKLVGVLLINFTSFEECLGGDLKKKKEIAPLRGY